MSEEIVEAQKQTMPVLFIGGPKDGHRVDMEALPALYSVTVPNPKYNALVANGNDNGDTQLMFMQVMYRREAFRSPAGLYPVYVYDQVPQCDVIYILLDGYRQLTEEMKNATKH